MSDKRFISRSDFDAATTLGTTEIEVPEWGGWIRLQQISTGDLIDWMEANEGPAKKTAGIRLIVASVIDESGRPMFTERDIAELRKKPVTVISKLVDAIQTFNGLKAKPDAKTDAKNG